MEIWSELVQMNERDLTNQKIPKLEEKFSNEYRKSKWGTVSDIPEVGIDKRYQGQKTILHNEAINYEGKESARHIVALAKMGANISLLDENNKSALEYLTNEQLNEVEKDLDNTKEYVGTISAIRLRRLSIEIEIKKYKNGEIEAKELNTKIDAFYDMLVDFIYKNIYSSNCGYKKLFEMVSQFIVDENNMYLENNRNLIGHIIVKRARDKHDDLKKLLKNDNMLINILN